MNTRLTKHLSKDEVKRYQDLAIVATDLVNLLSKVIDLEKESKVKSIISHSYSKDTSIYLSGVVGELKAYDDVLVLLNSLKG